MGVDARNSRRHKYCRVRETRNLLKGNVDFAIRMLTTLEMVIDEACKKINWKGWTHQGEPKSDIINEKVDQEMREPNPSKLDTSSPQHC